MEQINGYRLERWIAVLLGLLFFLPFVARGDELLYTDSYHGDEIAHVSGERFLALVVGDDAARLEPVSIRVRGVYDPIEDLDGEMSGKRVEVEGHDDVFLLRSARLRAGNVVAATPARTELPIDAPLTITLGATHYTLDSRCGNTPDPDGIVECAIVLDDGTRSQVLAHVFQFFEAGNEMRVFFSFAGDLDGDQRLDLLLDISKTDHEWHPALFLSSAAADGELVAKVAELVTYAC
ncbi:MAG TPA: hypothetical protein VNA69_17845 [Thermoanaerobaculia bacterium]|nr:hypothetical protein [Thermoanaerobaculia bacterium]